MRVAICGAGYVGLASALTLAHAGHEVRVLDRDPQRVALLERGADPLGEPHFSEALASQPITFTAQSAVAYAGVDVILVTVGTPTTASGAADLSQLDAAASALAATAPSCTVLVRSTVPVGTADRLQSGILQRFRIVSNPEFLREGHAIADSVNPERIVAGGAERDEPVVRALYRAVLDRDLAPVAGLAVATAPVPFLWMDRRSAELAKYAANAFLATKLSFVNEIANVAAQVGADIRAVTRVVGSDARIGSSFLRPGIGWGGSCFPKDARALAAFALDSGYDFTVLRAVIEQNNKQLDRFFDLIRSTVGAHAGIRIGLLGLAFKAGTADCRESPAVGIAQRLLAEGCQVRAFDPAVLPGTVGLPGGLVVVRDLMDAAAGADALVVATEWPEFAAADYASLARGMRGDVVLDGRCLLDPAVIAASGLRYAGICPPGPASD